MTWYLRIKNLYDAGLWTKKQVHDTVGAGRITTEEYEKITGDVYDPNKPPIEEPSEETGGQEA